MFDCSLDLLTAGKDVNDHGPGRADHSLSHLVFPSLSCVLVCDGIQFLKGKRMSTCLREAQIPLLSSEMEVSQKTSIMRAMDLSLGYLHVDRLLDRINPKT